MSNSVDLALVAGQTVKQLGEIWDVLGEPANERERHVQALCAEVVAVYNNLLAAQRSRVADAQARIDLYASTMRSLSLELAEPTPPVFGKKLAVNHFFFSTRSPARCRMTATACHCWCMATGSNTRSTRFRASVRTRKKF